jgi:hypothetical protein
MEILIFLRGFFRGFMSGAVYKKLSHSLSVPGPRLAGQVPDHVALTFCHFSLSEPRGPWSS